MDFSVPAHLGGQPDSSELLVWLNQNLQTNFTTIEEVCTGAAFCQLMDWCHEGSVDLTRVRFQINNTTDSLHNFNLLKAAFKKVGVLRYIPVKTLVEKNSVVGLAFLHWFKQYFEKNQKIRQYDPLLARAGQRMVPEDCQSQQAAPQTLEFSTKLGEDNDTRNDQSKEKTNEDTSRSSDAIILISDEDDEDDIADKTEQSTSVTEHTMKQIDQTETVVVNGLEGTHSCWKDTLLCFIRRYCGDTNLNNNTNEDALDAFLSPSHPRDIIQSCYQTPFCLYLFVGVDLDKGRTTSVVMIGYFDKSCGARVVKLLLTLQMSVDTVDPKIMADLEDDSVAGTQNEDRDDGDLLIYSLKKVGLPLSNLSFFYCNAPTAKLRQVIESKLQAVSRKCLSLCGLPWIAERACQAALLASFPHVDHLIKDIYHNYTNFFPFSQSLKNIFDEAKPYDPSKHVSAQCLFIIHTVQKMVLTWRGLVAFFRSVKQVADSESILARLMDHKVKLHFLFLSHALDPLMALQELQEQPTAEVAFELQLASVLLNVYIARLLKSPDKENFLKNRDLQLLHDEKNLISTVEVNLGHGATDFLWATAVIDLGEQERMDFLRNAMTFYKVALTTVVENIPKQLGDVTLRNIPVLLQHPEKPQLFKLSMGLLLEFGVQMGLCDAGSSESEQLANDYEGVLKWILQEQKSGERKHHDWAKVMHNIPKNSVLQRLILTLLALPGPLNRTRVFAEVIESVSKGTPRPSAKPGRIIGRPRVCRRRPGHAIHGGKMLKEEMDDGTSSEEDAKFQIKPKTQLALIPPIRVEDSEYTDNSSETGEETPEAESVYVVPGNDCDENMDSTTTPYNTEETPSEFIGELVWGKIDGFSTWPGITVPCNEEDLCSGKRMVKWYAQNMSSKVSPNALEPFSAFTQNFCSNSLSVFVTYREAVFLSLQEAALRCQKQFSVDLMDKEEQLKQMLDWAFGGFLPTGPGGLNQGGLTNVDMTKNYIRPKAQKKLFSKDILSYNTVSFSSLMSNKSNITSESQERTKSSPSSLKPGDRKAKLVMKEKKSSGVCGPKQGRGEREGERDEFGAGCGRGRGRGRGGWRGGRVQQKNGSHEGFDDDMSPDFVPSKKRSLTKPYSKADQRTSVYTQPDQKIREEIIRNIMNTKLDIEGFCLCCATEDVEIPHPLFKGSLCCKCKDNLTETLYRYDDDGYQSYCTVCCYGLEVILCGNDSCNRSYCTDCLDILVGPGTFDELKLKDPWICFLCQPHTPHGALIPRDDWSIRVQELFANNSAMEFEPHRVYPSIPANLRKPIRVLSLFDGIATGYLVLKELGFKVEKYVASEICEDSITVSVVQHDEKIIHVGDACSITEKQLEKWGPFDLLIGGSPCNDLSIVNPNRKGLYEGTGRLFFDYYRILQLLKPKEEDPRPFFWMFENVVFMNNHDKFNICRFLECNPVLVNAVHVSPAHRARCFWGNIPGMGRPIIASQNDKLSLQDCLEVGREARVTKVRTITTNRNSLKQGKDVSLLPVLHYGKEDNIWITELERIFGFPKHYTDVRDMNRQQRQKVLGKSWSVPVIRHLFAPLKDYFACEELPYMTHTSLNTDTSNLISNTCNCKASSSASTPASPELQQLR